MDTFKFLKDNLIRNFIFYIPTEAIALLESTIFKDSIPLEACNSIVFMDKDLIVSTQLKKFSLLFLASKKDFLDANLMQLFEAKKRMEEAHFSNLFEKYMTQIEGYLFASIWMCNNINRIFGKIEESTVNLFKYQQESFENHNHELIQNFNAYRIKNIQKHKELTAHFKDKFSDPNFKITVPNFPNKSVAKQHKTKTLKEKKLTLSNEEIDRFLLTTVFNVDL